MKKVLLVERHAITRDGIRHILESTRDYIVGCELSDGDALISTAENETFDAAILDIVSLGSGYLELIRQLAEHVPSIRILALSGRAEPTRAKATFTAGASGFISKDSTSIELLQATRSILQGHKYMSTQIAERMVRTIDIPPDAPLHSRLTDREAEVLRHLASGDGIAEIGREMGLSPKTISTYKARLFDKLELRSDAALIRYAVAYQIIEPD
ncbi:response regulator transcription factor [Burkholderia contaminans]|uniref:LuxR C-terminal-related transcriptional regulator n=2 Tax=Burkholderiaceae TaxID=119060 RepID=UPI000863957E|nr:response regulator transcription factor [Burkholderia contaminans]AOL05551.1 two-component system response regulator [Burkholderia contaminans]TCW70329.1 DNA-binding response regulator [Burkholderia sp. SRS-25]